MNQAVVSFISFKIRIQLIKISFRFVYIHVDILQTGKDSTNIFTNRETIPTAKARRNVNYFFIATASEISELISLTCKPFSITETTLRGFFSQSSACSNGLTAVKSIILECNPPSRL